MTDTMPPLVKPEFTLIEDLFSEIQNGRLRVPRFQRPFVWKPGDMIGLFDSIRRGYPIGSLLLWDTSEQVLSTDQVGPIEVPEPGKNPVTYILDGQQRLSTLYGVLRLPSDFPKRDEQKYWQWWIYYDLKNHKFLHLPSVEQEPHLLPLRALLRTTDFLKEARRIEEAFGEKEAAALIDKAESLAQKFKSYKVATIRIQGGSLEEAVDIFSRLNTTGQKMTPDQMISALTYREGEGRFHLARRIDEISERLEEYHLGSIRRTAVFRSIVAAAGFDIHSTAWADLAKRLRDELPTTVDVAECAILQAAEFLFENLGVPGDKLLPYSYQLLLLSEFFRCCPDPSREQEAILKKWFWVTSFSGWFAGANSTQIREAIDEFRGLADGSVTELRVMPLDDKARPFPSVFDMRSARLRALLLAMMQKLEPRNVDGSKLNARQLVWEHGNRAFIHIFRRAPAEVVSNPANRILLPAPRRQTPRRLLLSIPDAVRADVLASHGISDEAHEALVRDDAVAFIKARAHHLAQFERAFMAELGITPPSEEFGEADIDTDDE